MSAIRPLTTRNELDLKPGPVKQFEPTSVCFPLNPFQLLPAALPLLLGNLDTLPQALYLELLTRAPAVDVLDVVGCGLEVARGVVALGDVDLVLGAVLQGLVQGDGGSQELLLDLAEAL